MMLAQHLDGERLAGPGKLGADIGDGDLLPEMDRVAAAGAAADRLLLRPQRFDAPGIGVAGPVDQQRHQLPAELAPGLLLLERRAPDEIPVLVEPDEAVEAGLPS